MKRAVALSLLALAACGQPAPEPAPAAPQYAPGQVLDLACDVFAGATAESLAAQYGEANVVSAVLPGVEGQTFDATVIFPNDPMRRLEIRWRDPVARAQISDVSISGDNSDWRGPNGLALGQGVAEVEAANGRPFQLHGFGWDYGGNVSDWNGGDFAPRGDCVVSAKFQTASDDARIMGEGPRLSDAADIRAAEPRLVQIGLGFRAPQ